MGVQALCSAIHLNTRGAWRGTETWSRESQHSGAIKHLVVSNTYAIGNGVGLELLITAILNDLLLEFSDLTILGLFLLLTLKVAGSPGGRERERGGGSGGLQA